MAKGGQTYGDKLILSGLKMWKETKEGAKKQFKHDVKWVKSKLKRKKKPESTETVRTKTIEESVGDIADTPQYKRIRRKK